MWLGEEGGVGKKRTTWGMSFIGLKFKMLNSIKLKLRQIY